MPTRLRDKNFAAMLEALIEYACDGRAYSFVSDGEDTKLVITITVDDNAAYTTKHTAALAKMLQDTTPAPVEKQEPVLP